MKVYIVKEFNKLESLEIAQHEQQKAVMGFEICPLYPHPYKLEAFVAEEDAKDYEKYIPAAYRMEIAVAKAPDDIIGRYGTFVDIVAYQESDIAPQHYFVFDADTKDAEKYINAHKNYIVCVEKRTKLYEPGDNHTPAQ